MALVVSSLTEYVEQNEAQLISSSHFNAKTQKVILSEGTVYKQVKYQESINRMETGVTFQTNTGCLDNSSGNITFTQRVVVVEPLMDQQEICVDTLNKYYLQKIQPAGSGTDVFGYTSQLLNQKAEITAQEIEKLIWRGDKVSGSGNLAKMNGMLYLLTQASTDVIQANQSAYLDGGSALTSFTSSNVLSGINAMWAALPAGIIAAPDIRIFCGWDIFGLAIRKYTSTNFFNYSPQFDPVQGEIVIPGTTYKLTAVHGLTGTNRMVALRMPNFFLGTDIVGEETLLEVFYDKRSRKIFMRMNFKLGVNFAIPEEIVDFKLA